jgi:hypothetical protein
VNGRIVPQLAVVRVTMGGGPYRTDDLLTLAFVDPEVARLLKHGDANEREPFRDVPDPLVPETISVEVVRSAPPHERNARLLLSFIDPTLTRVFPANGTTQHIEPAQGPASIPEALPQPLKTRAAETLPAAHAVLCYARWNEPEARRFIAVVDKLFTIDRLGWYRHVLAMRLLLPDEILLSETERSTEATIHLASLRTAAADALNAPLLAVYMPHFTIDGEWLRSIETPAMSSAVSGLRELLNRTIANVEIPEVSELSGTIARDEWLRWGCGGLDAFLALLLPNRARQVSVAQRLSDYRSALLELFGQMEQAPPAVRMNHMTQANHLLDDRLWNLAGAFQDAWGTNAPE